MSQFGSGIQWAPLQVYHAGLAFTPPDSILGQSFSSFKSSRWSAQGSLDDLRHKPSFRTFEGDGRPINVVAWSVLGILAYVRTTVQSKFGIRYQVNFYANLNGQMNTSMRSHWE